MLDDPMNNIACLGGGLAASRFSIPAISFSHFAKSCGLVVGCVVAARAALLVKQLNRIKTPTIEKRFGVMHSL
jgi:hypothetical protein